MEPAVRPGWSKPKPDLIPRPTVWPSALALAVALLGWGLLTSVVLLAIAVILSVVALGGWIGDLRHEHDQD
jgi:hypothetical protein